MANCPNCGRATVRTLDWACQWCGYPLVSGSFQQISKTYQEVKTERLHSLVPVGVVDSDVYGETGVALPTEGTGAAAETEAMPSSKAEPLAKVEPSAEPETVLEGEPVTEAAEEATVAGAPADEARPEQPPHVIAITVEELNRVCEGDDETVEASFAGSRLQISGVVGRILPRESVENLCIILTGVGRPAARNVLCVFDKQYEVAVSQLSVGQPVTIEGKYDGCIINILVTDCVLVD